MDKARNTAVRILHEVHEKGAYANVALARELRRADLSDMDRRFVTELVYGAVKAGDTIDWILRRYVTSPLKKIEPMVRDILRLGIYQLFYLEPLGRRYITFIRQILLRETAGTSQELEPVIVLPCDDIFLSYEIHRSYQFHPLIVPASKLWHHRPDLTSVEHSHQYGLDDIVIVMTKCDLIAAELLCLRIKMTAPLSGTYVAVPF